jgi:tetratricopeptide (TPR) repeat protein
MKTIYYLTTLLLIAFSSCNTANKSKTGIALGDTIQTPSGLQYIYLKKGTGRKVETGSKVGTYLSLKVNDDEKVIWNTNQLPDSLFSYVADYSKVIKGFAEVTMLLREGDEIVAILPDSLAYGSKGAGDIVPANATLVYNEFKMLKVETSKAFLSDLLFADVKNKSTDEAVKTYQRITTSADSVKYHTDSEQLLRVWDQLTADSLYQQASNFASQLGSLTNSNYLNYKAVLSLESLGEFEKAKENLELLLTNDPEAQYLIDKLAELNEKLLAEK